MSMMGRTYLERGRGGADPLGTWRRAAYVLIRREDGQLVVRPFRGLRRSKDVPGQPSVIQKGTP